MLYLLGFACLALAALGLIAQLAWTFRAPFWRHHDHLIPPASRSYRAAR